MTNYRRTFCRIDAFCAGGVTVTEAAIAALSLQDQTGLEVTFNHNGRTYKAVATTTQIDGPPEPPANR